MTDQELIEKLRLGFANPIVAADRIEDLLKFSSYWHNRAEALEAKLTKAVEALLEVEADCDPDYPASHGAIKHAICIVLAELEGEPLGAEFQAVWDNNKGKWYES